MECLYEIVRMHVRLKVRKNISQIECLKSDMMSDIWPWPVLARPSKPARQCIQFYGGLSGLDLQRNYNVFGPGNAQKLYALVIVRGPGEAKRVHDLAKTLLSGEAQTVREAGII